MKYKYVVKLNREIVNEGITEIKKEALNGFKGYGRNSYGSITEINEEGESEIGYKKIGGKLYCW